MGRNSRSRAAGLLPCIAALSSLLLGPGLAAGAPGVTHIFLLIGQSNMSGRGLVESVDRVPHARVYAFAKDMDWVPAVDPIAFDKPMLAGVGPGRTFGNAIADSHPDWVVGLVPAAFGGTTLDQWSPGGKLYGDAVARTRAALRGGARLAAILWLQGESETPLTAQTYVARFSQMASRLRDDLGAADAPIIVGELGRFVSVADAMNPQLARIPASVRRCSLVSSLGLTDKGDRLHFDSHSARELGRRYAGVFNATLQPGR